MTYVYNSHLQNSDRPMTSQYTLHILKTNKTKQRVTLQYFYLGCLSFLVFINSNVIVSWSYTAFWSVKTTFYVMYFCTEVAYLIGKVCYVANVACALNSHDGMLHLQCNINVVCQCLLTMWLKNVCTCILIPFKFTHS